MDLRYALRELERVIGEPERAFNRLEDGRTAVFRHTYISKMIRHSFYERRDISSIISLRASVAVAVCANARIPLSESVRKAYKSIDRLQELLLPYVEVKGDKDGDGGVDADLISSMFAELEMVKSRESKEEPAVVVEEK